MSEYVEVPFEGKAREKATLLLAAAEELGVGQDSVQTRIGAFYVPKEVRDKAFGDEVATSKSDTDEEKSAGKKRTKKSTSSDNQE